MTLDNGPSGDPIIPDSSQVWIERGPFGLSWLLRGYVTENLVELYRNEYDTERLLYVTPDELRADYCVWRDGLHVDGVLALPTGDWSWS